MQVLQTDLPSCIYMVIELQDNYMANVACSAQGITFLQHAC